MGTELLGPEQKYRNAAAALLVMLEDPELRDHTPALHKAARRLADMITDCSADEARCPTDEAGPKDRGDESDVEVRSDA